MTPSIGTCAAPECLRRRPEAIVIAKLLRRLQRSRRAPVGSEETSRGAARDRTDDDLMAKADAARDKRDFAAATRLYERALAAMPGVAAIHIQAGHMFKEVGALADAERHYLEASRLTPDDADLALQLGHFYKVAGRPAERDAAYRRAADLSPGWSEPLEELAAIRRAAETPRFDPAWATAIPDLDRLAPELAPTPAGTAASPPLDGVYIRRLGRAAGAERLGPHEHPARRRGDPRILRLFVSDRRAENPPRRHPGRRRTGSGRTDPGPRDSAKVRLQRLGRSFRDRAGPFAGSPCGSWPRSARCASIFSMSSWRRRAPRRTFPAVTAWSSSPPETRFSRRPQIRGRASVVRAAERALLPWPPRNVLVVRTDQLGDLVVSIPALKRLRALMPEARLVALLTSANAELAETLGGVRRDHRRRLPRR